MTRQLVSVLTATYQRHELLAQCLENVRQQSYRPLEHVIVAEGPDSWVAELVERARREADPGLSYATAQCGRNWTGYLAASFAAVPFQVAQWLASGELLTWWADDERADPDHIASLVALLISSESDFVYARTRMHFHPSLGPIPDSVIGTDPPRCGSITNALYRAALLDYRGFRTHVGSATDWDQIEGWISAGARWAMLDRVTFSHRVDKLGDGPDARLDRQPLRGQTPRVGVPA